MDNISKGLDEAISEELANPPKSIMTDSPQPSRSWRMAEQYFRYADFEIETKPNNDGYVATIKLGFKTRRVFFDPAGRVTHVSHVSHVSNLNAAQTT